MNTALAPYDRQTLEYLRAGGVDSELVRRVEASLLRLQRDLDAERERGA